MVRVLMYGGCNYILPDVDDVEVFDTVQDAVKEWHDRLLNGYWQRGSNGMLHPCWGDGLYDEDIALYDMDADTYYTVAGDRI